MAAARSATSCTPSRVTDSRGMFRAAQPSLVRVMAPTLASLVPVEVTRVLPGSAAIMEVSPVMTLPCSGRVSRVSPAASATLSMVEWECPSMRTSMPSTAASRSTERLPLDSSSMPRWARHTTKSQPSSFNALTSAWAMANISLPAGKVTPLILAGWALVAVSGVLRPKTPIFSPPGAVKTVWGFSALPSTSTLAETTGNLASLATSLKLG